MFSGMFPALEIYAGSCNVKFHKNASYITVAMYVCG
jgi:hypothetical protein